MFHSNASPFNQRQTKAGPASIPFKSYHESQQKPTMESLSKRSSSAFTNGAVTTSRPIITNSRVKKDEKYRKDMYLSFINNALLQKSKGVVEPFNELVSQFTSVGNVDAQRNFGTPTSQLRLWLSALSHVVSQLERTHSALVTAIVNMPWAILDVTFVKSYISFIGMLVSARPEYLGGVLEKIARGMTFRSGMHAVELHTPEGSSAPLTRRVIYDRLHSLLEHLLSLIPTLPSSLQPLLVRNFPHKRQDRADQETYIRNLLRITEYCPALSDRILATIIDRAIQIDVEIQIEMEELEGEDGAQVDGEIFALDVFDIVVGQEGDSDSDSGDDDDDGDISDVSSAGGDPDEQAAEIRQDVTHVREMVTKLDGMLKLLFDFFNRTYNFINHPPSLENTSSKTPIPSDVVSPPTVHSRELRRTQFITLLSIFDRTIIRTFKSRYTQFLIFWFSSLDPEFTDMFQGMLVSKALLEDNQPIVTRAAAASYIASFVSRAQFVDANNARMVVGLLCDFLAAHLDWCAAMGDDLDFHSTQHTVFYAVAQAVFLIFCFRWRDFRLDEEHEELDDLSFDVSTRKKWIPKLDVVQRVITSELNPLMVCSANVVQQFARVARSTGFVYCYTIIENNKRSSPHGSPVKGRRTSSLALRDSLDADLNTFFPFDPYKLPLSYSYIQGVYRDWDSVAIDDDEEEEDEEEDEDVGELPVMSGRAWKIEGAKSDDDEETAFLGTSFGGMSISPVRPSMMPSSITSSL
ncbi:hypothetical protein M422DRAFT_198368 [Sphaerobolus stellatus SS14]|nr:hypothetical protein M422DRAFT_198368 [Sphaerobolus stellatus SS14]